MRPFRSLPGVRIRARALVCVLLRREFNSIVCGHGANAQMSSCLQSMILALVMHRCKQVSAETRRMPLPQVCEIIIEIAIAIVANPVESLYK